MKECYITSFWKSLLANMKDPPPPKKKKCQKRLQQFLDLFVTIYFPVYVFREDRGWWSCHQFGESWSEGPRLHPPSNILLERPSRHCFIYTSGNWHSQGKDASKGLDCRHYYEASNSGLQNQMEFCMIAFKIKIQSREVDMLTFKIEILNE